MSQAENNLTVLVHVQFKSPQACEDLQEFRELARSSGCVVEHVITTARDTPDKRHFVGLGIAESIAEAVVCYKVDVVLFNHELSPSQVRNLEKLVKCRVIDRTTLILDIFAMRARTFEGKLQVELAQLQHLASRLVRGWTHLERQKGGIGLRGPGETQLETDRRLLRQRVKAIKKRLEKVRTQRSQSRQSRRKANCLTVALVGYTNAGKSTLFNALTTAEVYVQDQLFATLDPTLRRIKIPEVGQVVLADTVGFIRHLPHDLVEAFRATLEETRDADLLLHVIDASDPMKAQKIEEVQQVLTQIDAAAVPQLKVYNKIDLLETPSRIDHNDEGQPISVWLSAKNNQDFTLLTTAVKACLAKDVLHKTIVLQSDQGAIRHKLYALEAVLSETITEQGDYQLEIRLPKNLFQQLRLVS